MWPDSPDEFESRVSPPEGATQSAWYFLFLDGRLASLVERGVPKPIDEDAFRWLEVEVQHRHYLGPFRGRACYAVSGKGKLPEGYSSSDLRGWLGRVESSVFYLAGRAKQILDWLDTHRYCGRCGTETVGHSTDRARECPKCGNIAYPRLSPSIIVLVRRGEEMLLARNANWPTGFYSTLAGFVEPGESVEQTLHREVFEEVGVTVNNLRYLGSQSWPFPNSLMLGYHADYVGGDIVCQEGEIADARWFRYDELPNVPPGTAISSWLIEAFVKERKAAAGG